MQSLNGDIKQDFHYSGVVVLEKKDVDAVKEILAKALENSIDVIKVSKEECMYALTMDFFQV